ncbi:MAG: Zn-ribbon domain-containing OB-fold protein [Candidatus Odinarchaeota archaeon]
MNYNEKIEWKKCEKCGFLQHTSHLRCLRCKNREFFLIEATGVCKLLTYTLLNEPPAEFRNQGSYALGVVEFENGIKALGQIIFKENLKTGINLKPVYKKICDNLDGKEIHTFVFEPI